MAGYGRHQSQWVKPTIYVPNLWISNLNAEAEGLKNSFFQTTVELEKNERLSEELLALPPKMKQLHVSPVNCSALLLRPWYK